MIRVIFFLVFVVTAAVRAEGITLLVKEDARVLVQEGDCTKRYSPCSTFKIAIALMGYDDGFLTSVKAPELPYKAGYIDTLKVWKQPHTPTSWIKHSCIWYSQAITRHLGEKKFETYVQQFDYGNQDTSGDIVEGKPQNNGLTHCWLLSSLRVSPQEQVTFLQKLMANTLPVSKGAQVMTQKLLFLEDLDQGWQLYGKTGGGRLKGKERQGSQIGWFVGWIQKGPRRIVFACLIKGPKEKIKAGLPRPGLLAKKAVKARLLTVIQKEPK